MDLALRYWGIRELGDMHHDPSRNVLHLDQSMEALAAASGQSVETLRPLLDLARQALMAARAQRPTPFIDRTLYTGWNAMAISAYLEAARILSIRQGNTGGVPHPFPRSIAEMGGIAHPCLIAESKKLDSVRDFALLTLDRLLADAWDGGQLLFHVIAYGDQAQTPEKVPGTLDDYAFTLHACLDAWVATGTMRYYQAAVQLADGLIARFHDAKAGAFFDSAAPSADAPPLGALTARRKPLQDSPTPAGNPTAASALLRLEALSGRSEYRQIAAETLASFAGIVEHFGLYAGSYGLALERLLLDPVQVVVVGSGAQADALESAATTGFAVHKTVLRVRQEQLIPGGLPEALAETLLQLPRPAGAEAWAVVCRNRACLQPVTDAEALRVALG
jgi:hypothetical protein